MLEAQTAIPKASDLEKDVPTKISLADALNEAAIALDNFPKFDDMPFWKIAAILMSLGLSLFMFAIEETIVSTSVSAIGSAVNAKGSLSWITTSYLLTTTVFQPISGRAADAFGTKRLLIGSLWVFIIGMIITGTSQDLTQLVAGRFIAGAGGAGLLSYPCILISQLTNERQRSSYMNLINVTFIVGDALGPILGGAMARSGNWRWIFLFTPPLGPIGEIWLFVMVAADLLDSHLDALSISSYPTIPVSRLVLSRGS
ncbi:major facilitator superfamily domain-containing protein [Mycena floridula]|nr:major facilitator superfamily domain-containing protein [Mycena floridula]